MYRQWGTRDWDQFINVSLVPNRCEGVFQLTSGFQWTSEPINFQHENLKCGFLMRYSLFRLFVSYFKGIHFCGFRGFLPNPRKFVSAKKNLQISRSVTINSHKFLKILLSAKISFLNLKKMRFSFIIFDFRCIKD